jgi:hypothetical protein
MLAAGSEAMDTKLSRTGVKHLRAFGSSARRLKFVPNLVPRNHRAGTSPNTMFIENADRVEQATGMFSELSFKL